MVLDCNIKHCGICGHPIDITLSASWCIIGRTLDGHDMTLTNDPVQCEVDRCPVCGFCSPDIEDPRDVTKDDLQDPVYRKMLETRSPHECAAYLLSLHGHHMDAAYMLLHSAWLHEGNGIWLRNLAIREMLKEPPEEDDLIIMADMLRCVGNLEGAKTVVDAILSEKGNAPLWKRAVKELELIRSGDTRSDVISDETWNRTIDDVTMYIEVSEEDYLMMVSSDEPLLVQTIVYCHPSDGDIVTVISESSGNERRFTVAGMPDEGAIGCQRDQAVIGTNMGSTSDTGKGSMVSLWLQKERITEVWPMGVVPDSDHLSFYGCLNLGKDP